MGLGLEFLSEDWDSQGLALSTSNPNRPPATARVGLEPDRQPPFALGQAGGERVLDVEERTGLVLVELLLGDLLAVNEDVEDAVIAVAAPVGATQHGGLIGNHFDFVAEPAAVGVAPEAVLELAAVGPVALELVVGLRLLFTGVDFVHDPGLERLADGVAFSISTCFARQSASVKQYQYTVNRW